MTGFSTTNDEYEIPGQEEARMAISELADNTARSFRDAEARMAADPNYHPHIGDCGGFLLPSQIEDLYERYPRIHPPDPEFDEYVAERDQQTAGTDGDVLAEADEYVPAWKREHPSTPMPPPYPASADFIENRSMGPEL